MLEQAADVVAGHVRQAGVAHLVVEERLAVLPERLVAVHAGAVVPEERLGHEGDRVAVLDRGVLDDVLVQHQVVGGLEQRAEPEVDLGLAGGAHLVVLHLGLDAGVDQAADHLGAQVGEVVHRRHREVAALVARLVPEVAALLGLAGVPGALDRVDVVVGLAGAAGEAHIVEDVELGLGAEERGVRDAGALEVLLSLASDVARVAAVGLAGQRVVDEEVHDEGLVLTERVQHGGRRVGQQQHVRLVDGLEPADRRSVEHETVSEDAGAKVFHGEGEVVRRAGQVGKPDVDELHPFVPYELQDVVGGAEHPTSQGHGLADSKVGLCRFHPMSRLFHRC